MTKGRGANDLAFLFFSKINKRANQQEIRRTIGQASNLLRKYSFSDLEGAIDYYVFENPPYGGVSSLGYLFSAMDKYLDEQYYNDMKEEELKVTRGDDVDRKTQSGDSKSRVRETYNFDMFKKPEED